MSIIAAPFYAPRREHPKHRYDYFECLRVQRESCGRFGVEQLVITDAVALDELPCFSTDLPHELMHAILRGQLALLETVGRRHNAADILLIGADGLLARDPRPLFDGSFDLAVTTHPFCDCILNTGLIAVPAGCAGKVIPIWQRALDRCGTAWGDDQKALAAELDPTLQYGIHDRAGLRVRFLPCDGWNEAPLSVNHWIDALIVHFRGPRKAWMREWAKRHSGEPR